MSFLPTPARWLHSQYPVRDAELHRSRSEFHCRHTPFLTNESKRSRSQRGLQHPAAIGCLWDQQARQASLWILLLVVRRCRVILIVHFMAPCIHFSSASNKCY
jgi:hypothetical protein